MCIYNIFFSELNLMLTEQCHFIFKNPILLLMFRKKVCKKVCKIALQEKTYILQNSYTMKFSKSVHIVKNIYYLISRYLIPSFSTKF